MEIANNKKIAIITQYHGSTNYGGVLQAYALRKLIADMGYYAEQLRYVATPETSIKQPAYIISEIVESIAKKKVRSFIHRVTRYIITAPISIILQIVKVNKLQSIRHDKFSQFNRRHIQSSKIYTKDTIIEAGKDFDLFITGSDQVWNPNWFSEAYYLSFVPEYIPKISYAASTGVSSITQEQYNRIKPLINRFQHISVREENAVSILQNMTDKKIEQVLDPTLLLSSDDWNKIAADNPIKDPYVFAYILGNQKDNYSKATQFSKKKGLKLVTSPFIASVTLRQMFFGTIQNYDGPDVWVSLIRDAEYVITDSFHAAIFSIIYKKRFVILLRDKDGADNSMNSRIYSLCNLFPTIGKRVILENNIDVIEEEIDWENIYTVLNNEKKRCLNWISKACDCEIDTNY